MPLRTCPLCNFNHSLLMKNYIYLFFFMFPFFLSSCDTEGEDYDTGYYTLKTAFIYPQDAGNNYNITYNGKDARSQYVSRKDANGKLEVYDKEKNTLLFSQEITIEKSKEIKLIKLPGKDVDLYSEEKYINFTPTILFSGDASQYTASFNGQELAVGETNYLSVKDLTGKLQIFKKGVNEPLYSQEMTIAANSNINVMQLSETDFMEVPADDEPAPETTDIAKARFFYNDAFSSSSSIKINFYYFDENTWDWGSELPLAASVTLKKGELSSYVELELKEDYGYTSFLIDAFDVDKNEYITQYLVNYTYGPKFSEDGQKSIYKFVTYQLVMHGSTVQFNPIEALSTRWE